MGFADRIGTDEDARAALLAEIERREAQAQPNHTALGLNASEDASSTQETVRTPEEDTPNHSRGNAAHHPMEDTMSDNSQTGAAQGDAPTQPPTPAPAADQSPPDNVISLDQARGEGRTQALAELGEIQQLCQIAGCPERLSAFVAEKLSLAQVRDRLCAERAEASEAHGEVGGGRDPLAGGLARGEADQPITAQEIDGYYAQMNKPFQKAVSG